MGRFGSDTGVVFGARSGGRETVKELEGEVV